MNPAIFNKSDLDQARYEFSSLASHQLRTPLSALRWIINMFESKKTGRLNKLQRELILDAKSCIRLMSYTIRSLFLSTQLESKQLDFEKTRVGIKKVINEILSEHEHVVRTKHQKVKMDCSDLLEANTDKSMLREVLTNIIHNALKYTPEKGDISILARQDGQGIEISIKDSGYGIPDSEKNQIFNKFFRGTNILTHEIDGNGLGLYVAKGLSNLIGGSISFNSKENEGSLFKVRLPV